MKKLLLLCVAIATVVFTGCSKDDDEASTFKYGMDALYGKWQGTAVKSDGTWVDITTYPGSVLAFSATFNSDGTYSGDGFFGTGSGTYKAKGDTIITYIEDMEFARYKVLSLVGNLAEMRMTIGKESIDIRCQKQ